MKCHATRFSAAAAIIGLVGFHEHFSAGYWAKSVDGSMNYEGNVPDLECGDVSPFFPNRDMSRRSKARTCPHTPNSADCQITPSICLCRSYRHWKCPASIAASGGHGFLARFSGNFSATFSVASMKAKIIITPKKAVLDPQGKTVQTALEHMGLHRRYRRPHRQIHRD